MSNAEFFDIFAPYYSAYYADIDESEAVRRWVALFECDGLMQPLEIRKQSQPRLLDLGCGPGRHLQPWRAAGFQVSGIDVSPTMLRLAAQNADAGIGKDVALYCADIRDTESLDPLRNIFNWIASHFNFSNLFPPEELPQIFASISALLAAGGRFAMDVDLSNQVGVDIGISDYTGTANCRLIRSSAHAGEKRVDREWIISGKLFRETYWLHSIASLVDAANNAGMAFDMQKRLMMSHTDPDESQHLTSESWVVIFSKPLEY